ncbi:MAG: hypothetical protein EBR58_11340 [Betaproteobacteria bacterium]|nr:hypothetical protein [Betaproteobacteria bacterium]
MSTNDPVSLVAGAFSGPAEFAQGIRDFITLAADQKWPHMVWSDIDFEDWPLRERSVAEALNKWAGPGRTLTMLAKRYNRVTLLHPRFVQWRVTWSHLVDCRVVKHLDDSEMPSALLGPEWFLHRRELTRSIGVGGRDVPARVALTELLDECKRQSSPGFPATTLGL